MFSALAENLQSQWLHWLVPCFLREKKDVFFNSIGQFDFSLRHDTSPCGSSYNIRNAKLIYTFFKA